MTRTAAATADGATAPWSASPALWVLALAVMAAFQFWRGAPVDGALFTAFSVLLVAERVSRSGRAHPSRRRAWFPRPAPTSALATIVAVAVAVFVFTPRNGIAATILASALGIAALVLVWAPTDARRALPGGAVHRSRVLWAGIGIALCVWEAAAYVLSVTVPRGWIGFPTVSLLLEPAVEFGPSRVLLIGAWLLVGAWLVSGTRLRGGAARTARSDDGGA